MKQLKLNSIPNSVFAAADLTDNTKIAVNNQTISRADIVATGRLVACEYFGNYVNSTSIGEKPYVSRLNEKGIDYATLSRKHTEKKLLFCAAQVAKNLGMEAPKNFEEVRANAARYGRDGDFLKVMAAIDRDVLQPLFFDVLDAVGMDLMQWDAVPFGGTKQVDIGSNDVFLFEDGSWGSSRSTTKNYLYGKTLTLNPTMYTCNATIKWYQDIVAGDAGRYYAAIMRGMYSKIYAKLMHALKAATNTYIPGRLKTTTYSTENWIELSDRVASVNGVPVNRLMAIGTRKALSNVLPVDGQGGAITGLQYGLGERWFENGFLPKAMSVDLFPVSPAIVPTTQNTTIDTIDTGDNIYILAKGSYRPMMGGYFEGTPIDLIATPGGADGAQGTADFTIDINVSTAFDIKPVFASKVGMIGSAYNS